MVLARRPTRRWAKATACWPGWPRCRARSTSTKRRVIRRIGVTAHKVVGIFRKGAEGGRIVPIDKESDREWSVAPGADPRREGRRTGRGRTGRPARPHGPARGAHRRTAGRPLGAQGRLADRHPPARHSRRFPRRRDRRGRRRQARRPEGARGPARPAARHHRPRRRPRPRRCRLGRSADDDPKNAGGFILWVAIADVALYVTPGSALDREARERGNSTYFPDRVVPMLPDRLSGDLCSLHEGVAAPLHRGADGDRRARARRSPTDFHRGLMRSAASLTYEEVQAARDGHPERPLRARCWTRSSTRSTPPTTRWPPARAVRQPLELDLPERRIVLSRGRPRRLGHLPRPAGRAQADRGIHGAGQRRRRRGADPPQAPAAVPRARGAAAAKSWTPCARWPRPRG